MLAILNSEHDGNKKGICFASKEDAENFKSFVNIYMDESGAGNGYGTYWVFFDEKIIEVSENPGYFIRLDEEFIWRMLHSILYARTAGKVDLSVPEISIGRKKGGVTFSFGNLPNRIRPSIGDMFRSLQSLGAPKMEGRVVADDGTILKVISYQDEERDGKIREGAEVIAIEASKVMKIYDWKR